MSAAVGRSAASAPPPTSVWMDCDPGHDDAIALLLLCNHPALRVVGVTAVAGNQTVRKTYANAVKLLAIAGRADVPCYRGQARPMIRAPKHDPGIHGESGLDGSPTFDAFSREASGAAPAPERWAAAKGVLAMGEAIAADPAERITIIATGGRDFCRHEPEIAELDRLVDGEQQIHALDVAVDDGRVLRVQVR